MLESLELASHVAHALKDACATANLPLIFKASFDKANRSSIDSPRGPGLEQGLAWLDTIKHTHNLPVTTDIHDPSQADPVARVADLIQIPAFLCRQTDLLVAAARAASNNNAAVNIKKGQFLSPSEMVGPVHKCLQAGCDNILLTERGTFFGYHRLVNDLPAILHMMQLEGHAPPVCFDATHSTQTPGSSTTTGGNRALTPHLARAAVALGVHAVFLECHPDPDNALSDAASQLPLDTIPDLLDALVRIRSALQENTRG